jgi:hypothetical protein
MADTRGEEFSFSGNAAGNSSLAIGPLLVGLRFLNSQVGIMTRSTHELPQAERPASAIVIPFVNTRKVL